MTQPRRVSFTTLRDPQSSSLLKTFRKDDEEPESTEPPAKTARITLHLFEPDDERYPEFFYPDLLKSCQENGEGSSSGAKKTDPADPLDGDEKERQEVEALARKFEEKYGGKRHRKDRIEDLIDMGYGYDESDSFIDNSEAYDEYVPASLTTEHGGFYINSGTLQFRQVSESEDDCVETKCPKEGNLEDGGEKLKKKNKKKKKDESYEKKKKDNSYEKEKKPRKSKFRKSRFMALNASKEEEEKKKKLEKTEKKCFQDRSPEEVLKNVEKEKDAQKEKAEEQKVAAPSRAEAAAPREVEATAEPLPSLLGQVGDTKLLQARTSRDSVTQLELVLGESSGGSRVPEVENGSDAMGMGLERDLKQPPSLPEGLPAPLEKRVKKWPQKRKLEDGGENLKTKKRKDDSYEKEKKPRKSKFRKSRFTVLNASKKNINPLTLLVIDKETLKKFWKDAQKEKAEEQKVAAPSPSEATVSVKP